MSGSGQSVGRVRYLEAAACRPHPTRWWFSDEAESVEAYLLCTTCPVRAACLSFALDHPDLVGIWAATTTEERERMRCMRQHPSRRAPVDRDEIAGQ